MKKTLSWAESLDSFNARAKRSKPLAARRDTLIAKARRTLKLPLVRRVFRYEDIGRHRTWLDGRAAPLKEPAHTIFALAMSDFLANQLLAAELPLLAAAARISGDAKLVARVHEQLHEMAAWSPLQRPGWSAACGSLPPDGKDGNWLGTGTGVRAIADTIEIMGRDKLPPATVARFDQLLAAEIVSIVDDWTAKRPWFTHQSDGNAPLSNQWVLPTEGLIRACLALGRERHEAAYERGVANLFVHLDKHGSEGAFEEGIHYAEFTVISLISAARAMALADDRRAIDHPFLRQFPVWALHHFQPGGFFINAFDAFDAARGNKAMLKEVLGLSAVLLGSREALWALDHLAGGADESLAGLLSRALPRPPRLPGNIRPHASYTRTMRVSWRSDWTNDATGVWVRGGDPHDCKNHADRGHVNFILKGNPVFIEAGTPAYHNPRKTADYASGRGHNVLQLGDAPIPKDLSWSSPFPPGWQKHMPAPITVNRLDARGGDVRVDGTAGYDGLQKWLRHVTWSAGRLTVEDSVQLDPANRQVVSFRWHLGHAKPPRIIADGNGACVAWPGVKVSIKADTQMKIDTEHMPDHTLQYRKWDGKRPDHMHVCLVLKTTAPVSTCKISIMAGVHNHDA